MGGLAPFLPKLCVLPDRDRTPTNDGVSSEGYVGADVKQRGTSGPDRYRRKPVRVRACVSLR